MVVAITCALLGVAVYFASNQAFAMLSLSDPYIVASSEEQRSLLKAAGEALLAINNPGTIYERIGMYVSLFLVLLAGLIVSIVLLQGDRLGKNIRNYGDPGEWYRIDIFYLLNILNRNLMDTPTISAPFRMI